MRVFVCAWRRRSTEARSLFSILGELGSVQGGGGSCGFEWLFRTLLVTLVQGDGWPDDGLSRAVGFCHAFFDGAWQRTE